MRTTTRKTGRTESEEVDEVKVDPEVRRLARERLDEIDDLLDEIDEVLEQNAETFLKAYRQRGGQ